MNALDVARGAYARLPLETRLGLGRVLRHLPVSLKYGGTYRSWRRRIVRAAGDPAFAWQQQEAALLGVVARARDLSQAHRQRLAPVLGDGPLDAASLRAAWARIPILTSREVVAGNHRLCTVDPATLDECFTGGSSGRPVRFLLDRGRSPVEYAFVHAAWARAGFHPRDVRAVFRGVEIRDPSRMHDEPALGELRCSVFHLSDPVMAGYLAEIRRRGIAFLHGYPSALSIFAAYILRAHGPLAQIRGVLPISERIPAPFRATLARAFPGAVLAPFYGLSEKAAFATEVPGEPDAYVFDPLYGYTEIVDAAGAPLTRPGERGRLVSTGLLFPGMPLIRYETGDEAEIVAPPGPENGGRLTVRAIVPRHGHEYLVGRSGILVPLSGMLQVDEEIFSVGEFQFVQDEPGRVTLRVVPRGGTVPDFTGYLLRANRKAAGELDLRLEIVDGIPTTVRGKRKFIDQRLTVARQAADLAGEPSGA
ncbi:MAG: CoF synthetase [Methylobacterium frigidaeris]